VREHRWLGAVSIPIAATLLLSGCIGQGPSVVVGSEVTIGSTVSFTSMNPQSNSGRTDTNIAVAAATGARFFNFDETAAVVLDRSFGSVTKLSDDPLVVRYTIADGVRWSDGVAVDGADLLLNWAALSGVLNDPQLRRADPVGENTDGDGEESRADRPADGVYFDTGVNPNRPRGIQLARAIPQLSADRKSITMTYSAPFADWAIAMPSAGLPAHIVAAKGLGIEGSNQAKDAVVAAVVEGDRAALGPLSRLWNTGFDVADTAIDGTSSLLVSNGPYLISDIVPEQSVTLSQNPNYVGAHRPELETVTFRFFTDPLAVIQSLNTGAIQVATPPLTTSVVSALGALRFDTLIGHSARFEHLDLRVSESKSGVFDNSLVREAFLKVVPRQLIADALIEDADVPVGFRDSFLFQPGQDGYVSASAAAERYLVAEPAVDAAIALLGEAGVTAPEVCILYPSDDPIRAREFLEIQAAAAPAGFVVTDCSSADWQDRLGAAGEYDAALFSWEPATSGISELEQIFATEGFDNLTGYSNPALDALFAEIAASSSPVQRRSLRLRADALIWADHYGLPLFNYPRLTLFDKDEVTGILPSPTATGPYWNIWAWKPVLPE